LDSLGQAAVTRIGAQSLAVDNTLGLRRAV